MDNEKRIGIIGCGWLGTQIAQVLLDRGYEVVGTRRKQSGLNKLESLGVIPHELDLATSFKLGPLDSCGTWIICVPPGEQKASYDQQMQQVLQLATDNDINFIYCSTTGVYGPQNAMLEEDGPLRSERPAALKAQKVEELIQHSNVNYCILRMAGLIGPERSPGRFLAGRKNVAGPETPVNLLWGSDAAEAVVKVIEKEAWGEVYNLCSEGHPTREEFYTAEALTLDLQAPRFDEDSASMPYRIVSNTKAKEELGVEFKTLT